jgi:hypothetical protein
VLPFCAGFASGLCLTLFASHLDLHPFSNLPFSLIHFVSLLASKASVFRTAAFLDLFASAQQQ